MRGENEYGQNILYEIIKDQIKTSFSKLKGKKKKKEDDKKKKRKKKKR